MQWMAVIVSVVIIGYYILIPHKNAVHSLYWKTASSLSFLLLALTLYQPGSVFHTIMLAGLLLGALGDVLLALPSCYPKQEPVFFLLGLISFLFGHVCYGWALFHTTGTATILSLFLSVFLGAGMVLILKKSGIDFREMLLPAIVYAIVIMFLELQCISWLLLDHTMFALLLNIGSLLFVISDLILVFIVFGKRDERWITAANLTTYYTAQLCLAATFLLYQA